MNRLEPTNYCRDLHVFQAGKTNNFLKVGSAVSTIGALALVITAAAGALPLYVAYIGGAIGTVSLIAFAVLFYCTQPPVILKPKPTQPEYIKTSKPIRPKPPIKTSKPKIVTPPIKTSHELLIPFYTGDGRDIKGRTLENMLKWGDSPLESQHDFIQWLFPSFKPSDFYSDAPLLTKDSLAIVKNDKIAQDRLFRAFNRMLSFYGLQYIESKNTVQKCDKTHWIPRKKNWISSGNHNYRRITRILEYLVLMGREDLAQAFYNQLETIQGEEKAISSNTLSFWEGALFVKAEDFL